MLIVSWATCLIFLRDGICGERCQKFLRRLDTCLETSLLSQDLGKVIKIINIYGPYSNRQVFWENNFHSNLLSEEYVFAGGDFNFNVGEYNIQGESDQSDPLVFYFIWSLEEQGLFYMDLIKLIPTQHNMRVVQAHISKRFNRFLVNMAFWRVPGESRNLLVKGEIKITSQSYWIFLQQGLNPITNLNPTQHGWMIRI